MRPNASPRTLGPTLGLLALLMATPLAAQTLNGTVRSATEGPMGAVLVNAQHDGSSITVTVVSDAEGRFACPEGRPAAGRTRLSVRAVGYDLAGPEEVTLGAAPTTAALTLRAAGAGVRAGRLHSRPSPR